MIQFTSHDMAQHRADRLKKALRIAIQIAGITDEQADLLILGLRDQKGALLVQWRIEPSDQQKRAFEAAWELCGEKSVQHAIGE